MTLSEDRRRRVARAEGLLDRWLDLFEQSLDSARPDAAKTTELANLFTVFRRILEIEAMARKLDPAEDNGDGLRFDPDLAGDAVPGADPEL